MFILEVQIKARRQYEGLAAALELADKSRRVGLGVGRQLARAVERTSASRVRTSAHPRVRSNMSTDDTRDYIDEHKHTTR